MSRIRKIGYSMVDIDDISHVEWNSDEGVLWIDFLSEKRTLRMDRDVYMAGRELKQIAQDENLPNLAPRQDL